MRPQAIIKLFTHKWLVHGISCVYTHVLQLTDIDTLSYSPWASGVAIYQAMHACVDDIRNHYTYYACIYLLLTVTICYNIYPYM